jgi:exodeoxyribonuclease VII small subunit
MNKETTFEEALDKLQNIVKKLEAGDMPLEESLKAFEEGVGLSRFCQEKLSEAEKKIEILTKINADGSIETQSFSKKES